VALTRAQDRLCVTGWAGRREARDEEPSWHDLVGRAIGSIAGVEDYPFPLPDGETGRMRLLERGGAATPAPQSTGPSADAAALPEWAVRPAPVERALEPPLRPSFEENEEPAAASPAGAAAERAKRFGVEVHRLLHRLAEAAPEARPTLLDRYLAPGDESPEDAAELRRQVLGVLELPELAPAFGPGSRGEQPIIGRLGDRVISGQIDRLAVTDDAVYLVDFKTNRHPPAGLDGIPRLYLRQLAAYAGLAPTPWRSGALVHEQGVSKAGNPRLRTTMVQLAWLWLRHQPDSALTRWFHERTRHGRHAKKKTAIVALARKLLVALWKYVHAGVFIEGAVMKPAARP